MRLGGGLGGDSRLPKVARKKQLADAVARGVAAPPDDRLARYSVCTRVCRNVCAGKVCWCRAGGWAGWRGTGLLAAVLSACGAGGGGAGGGASTGRIVWVGGGGGGGGQPSTSAGASTQQPADSDSATISSG